MAREQFAPWDLDGTHSEQFVARRMRPKVLRDVDLVIGASSCHWAALVTEHPQATDSTFSLLEFAGLTAAIPRETFPADSVQRVLSVVVEARGLCGTLVVPDDDWLPDPTCGPPEAYQLCSALDLRRGARSSTYSLPERQRATARLAAGIPSPVQTHHPV